MRQMLSLDRFVAFDNADLPIFLAESDKYFLFLPILLDAQTEGISQSGLISQLLARHVTTLRYCGHRINAGRVLFYYCLFISIININLHIIQLEMSHSRTYSCMYLGYSNLRKICRI